MTMRTRLHYHQEQPAARRRAAALLLLPYYLPTVAWALKRAQTKVPAVLCGLFGCVMGCSEGSLILLLTVSQYAITGALKKCGAGACSQVGCRSTVHGDPLWVKRHRRTSPLPGSTEP